MFAITNYVAGFKDAEGDRLLGGSNTYKLHVLPNVPARNFWSVMVYDVKHAR